MNKDNKFFEDMYKLAGSAMNTAFGTVADMKKQFEDMVDSKIDEVLKKRGYVMREEFEVVRKMAEKAREEQEILAKKLEKIEKKLK
jgi:BMFP domain-containing protein YqiC